MSTTRESRRVHSAGDHFEQRRIIPAVPSKHLPDICVLFLQCELYWHRAAGRTQLGHVLPMIAVLAYVSGSSLPDDDDGRNDYTLEYGKY
jgi:hypothetical protein